MSFSAALPARDYPYATPRYVDNSDGCFFYHTMELPDRLREGCWDLREHFGAYIGYVDVEGKRVLDVGTASGFLTFEAEKQGAREVVSFDLDTAERQDLLPFAGSRYVEDHARWCADQTDYFECWKRAYWYAHRLLKSKARVVYGDVYDPPADMGMFDVVIVGAIIEHLIDPLGALRALARHASDIVVINTDFVDSNEPIALFKGRADIPENSFVFWSYSIALFDEYMKIMGFDPVGAHKAAFLGSRPEPGSPHIRQERVALVYRRRR